MSGTNTGRAPRSDPELARDLTRRIKTLENPSSVRVGSWVITDSGDGSLLASQPGKSFTLDAIPEQVTTFLRQATGGEGGGLYNIAEFLTAFTSATGIDLLDILGGVGTGGDLGDLPDVVAQIQEFLTGWLAGLNVDPTLATPGPLLDWFNSQLPDNVIVELTQRVMATAQDILDGIGLQLSDILGLFGLDTGGDPGGILGWLGNLFGGNLPPITPPAGSGDHPAGWEFWMDYWPPWVERQSGESTGQAWDRLLAAGKRPFPPFPFVLWAASFGDASPASSTMMSSAATLAAAAVNAVGDWDPNSPIPGYITIQTQIMNTLTELVSFLLGMVGITLHSDLPGGETVGTEGISQVLSAIWGNPTGTTAGSLATQMAATTTDTLGGAVDNDLLNSVLGFAGSLLGGGLRGAYDDLLRAFGLCDARSAATTGLGSAAIAAVNALSNPTGMTAEDDSGYHPILGGLINFKWDYWGGRPPWEGLSGTLTGLAGNPTGTSSGSLLDTAGSGIWQAINCSGAAGQGFNMARDITGVLGDPSGGGSALSTLTGQAGDLLTKLLPLGINIIEDVADVYGNPTGNSEGGLIASILSLISAAGSDAVGSVGFRLTTSILEDVLQFANPESASSLGYLLDLITSLFGDGGAGFNILASIINDLVGNPTGNSDGNLVMGTGNFCAAAMTLFFGGGLTEISRIAADILGIFGNPDGYDEGSLFGQILGLIGVQTGRPGSWVFSLLTAVASNNISSMISFLFSPANPSSDNSASVASGLVTSAATTIGLGDTTGGGGGLIGTISSYLTDFMGLFGNPDGLGTGNVIIDAVDDIPILGPLIGMLFQGLGGVGGGDAGGLRGMLDQIPIIGTLIEMLPIWMLNMLGPGAAGTSILPDANFTKTYGPDIAGAGQWCWAWPGPQGGGPWGTPGCVRTIRPGLITIYRVGGTWELFPGQLMPFTVIQPFMNSPVTTLQMASCDNSITDPAKIGFPTMPSGINLLDWSRFELIDIPFSGPVFPMGQAVAEGTAYLTALINQIPGKFILMGGSQGGAVVSDVYDQIRSGTLHHRNEDLLGGFVSGNIRREKGRSFPGGPLYCTAGYGAWNPLEGTEERWWEWSCGAGDYPAFGVEAGVTFDNPDPFSCLGDDLVSNAERGIIAGSMAATSMSGLTNELITLLQNTSGFGAILQGVGLGGGPLATPHGISELVVQPFLADGDTRTYVQYMFDYINDVIGPTHLPVPPPPTRHFIETVPVNVAPGLVVTAGASVEWMNVNCPGPAIMVGLNVYTETNELIATDQSAYDEFGGLLISMVSPATTVSSPPPTSTAPVVLSDHFKMPEGAHNAYLVFDVEPAAMATGVVFPGKAVFDLPGGTIDAAQLANMENIPLVPPANVEGTHGMDTLEGTLQHMVDNLSTAFNRGEEVLQASFPTLFTLAQSASTDAAQALALVKTLVSGYHEPDQTKFLTPGEHPYILPRWMEYGDLLEIVMCSAAGSGSWIWGADYNQGGTPGKWSSRTVALGYDLDPDTESLTVHVGDGGPAPDQGDLGANGGLSKVVTTDDITLLTVPGGLGGGRVGNKNRNTAGVGPGNLTYGGRAYFGGVTVTPNNVVPPGAAPGGAGCGAPDWWSGASAGAYGGVWITAIQKPSYTVQLSGSGQLSAKPLLNIPGAPDGRGALAGYAWDIRKPLVRIAGRGILAGPPTPALPAVLHGHGALSATATSTIQATVSTTATATLTLTTSYDTYVYTGASNADWGLYPVTGHDGNILIIDNRTDYLIVLTAAGGDSIDDAGTTITVISVNPGTVLELLDDGTRWLVMDRR